MSKKLEEYLSLIPEQYRNNLTINGKFCGNRSSISFKFLCGCDTTQLLKAFLKLKRFDYCYFCLHKFAEKFKCKYCTNEFILKPMFDKCESKCKKKYENLELGKDYVVCQLCNLHSRSLGVHVTKNHNISHKEYREKYGSLICTDASDNYRETAKENGNWIEKAKLNGTDLTEFKQKVSRGVKAAIMSDPLERKRRSELMTKLNDKQQSDPNFQKIVSETAKKTSARKDIQEERAQRLKNWREKFPEKFYNQCVKKMVTAYQSKPETYLYNYVSSLEGFSFKRNQFVHSELLSNKSSKKQLDMGDKKRRIYIEFDGVLHFLPKFGLDVLKIRQQKDRQIDAHILNHNWTLIRVSYDQFVYSTKKINKIKQDASYFKPECLQKIAEILKEKKPGVYKIGSAYEDNSETLAL